MKNIIKSASLLMIALLLAVACNIDSTEGLIQSAATAVQVIPYKSFNVIGSNSDYLFVSTDKGVCKVDGEGNYTILYEGGNIAKNASKADDTTLIYYDEDSNSVVNISPSGIEQDELGTQTMVGFFSQDSINRTTLVKNEDGSYTGEYYNTSNVPNITSSLSGEQLAIIGNGAYIGIASDGTYPTIYIDCVPYSNPDKNTRVSGAIGTASGVPYIVDINGKVYYWDSAESKFVYIENTGLNKSVRSNFIPMKEDTNGNIVYIYPGDSSSHLINTAEKKVESYSNSSLASTIPHLIVGIAADGRILVINENSGAYILEQGKSFTAVKGSNPIKFDDFV